MNDIVILHLSDLHIEANASKKYSRLLSGLLEDIKKEINVAPNGSVVVTVTGDTIHKGDKNAIPAAVKFFADLYNIIKNKVVAIYFVAGNHDKCRTKENSFLIPAYRAMGKDSDKCFDDAFYECFWKFQAETYGSDKGSGYLELTKKVYEIFGVKKLEEKSYFQKTFGVDVIDVLGKKYCFVMLNTAWSCIDDSDARQLILGKFQIDDIKRQYHELVDEMTDNVELTLVMGHHPIGTLMGREEDLVFSEMISFEELNANAYLCGHTHDRTVINWFNNRHSISTFMTGIGWPENNSGYHIGMHSYSMYVFNVDENAVDIYVRSTDDGGVFNPDLRLYTNSTDKTNEKIFFPIKTEKAQPYITLNSGPNIPPRAFYYSESFMNNIREYVLRIGQFKQSIGMIIESDKRALLTSIPDGYLLEEDCSRPIKDGDRVGTYEVLLSCLFSDFETDNDNALLDESAINDYFLNCEEQRFNMFLGFLQRVCQELQKALFNDRIEEGDVVRIHFRYLGDRNTHVYLKLCESFPEHIDSSDYELSSIKYGELIEASFLTGKGLVYSVNKDLCKTELKRKWKNFLTVVPMFEGNEFRRNYGGSSSKKMPFITFGVTVNSHKFDSVLYCMDYFSIKAVLEECIDTYIHLFRINVNSFCAWAQKIIENEKDRGKK